MSVAYAKEFIGQAVRSAGGDAQDVVPDSLYAELPFPDGTVAPVLLSIRERDGIEDAIAPYRESGEPVPDWLKVILRKNCARDGREFPPEIQ